MAKEAKKAERPVVVIEDAAPLPATADDALPKAIARIAALEGELRAAADALPKAEARVAELEGVVANLEKSLELTDGERSRLDQRVGELTSELASANERADRERERADAAEKRAEEAETAGAELARRLSATKGVATKAKREAEVLRLEKSPVSRPVGAPTQPYDRDALAAALDAGDVEIVFSNGHRELHELAPLQVGGDAFQRGSRGFALKQAVEVEPGPMDAERIEVRGFGLLADGVQVGWCGLPAPVSVPRNGRVQFDRCILF